MNVLLQLCEELLTTIHRSFQQLQIEAKQQELSELHKQMENEDFWKDSMQAQLLSKKAALLEGQVSPWLGILHEVEEVKDMILLGDDSLLDELEGQLDSLRGRLNELKRQLRFMGRYDDHNALLRLHAGAGGTDAQDWTEILLRMYLRWAEKSGIEAHVIEETRGEEAGIKSAVVSLEGDFVYGKLRGEHGVHRLVRLSPFNADHLRQTSFSLIEVLPQIDTPDEVVIDDKDLRIDVFRSSGHGGQSVNTTDSAVRITHIPTGIVVAIQNERSQLQNRETAMKILRSKLAQLQLEQHEEELANVKGPTQSAEWGNQIRNYVLHPYTLVKDTRTKYEERDTQAVLDGKIDGFIEAELEQSAGTAAK